MTQHETFEDKALFYVEYIDHLTSGESSLCSDLYHKAQYADVAMAEASHDMAVAQAKASRKLFAAAHDRKREAFEDGSDAITDLVSVVRHANCREGVTA